MKTCLSFCILLFLGLLSIHTAMASSLTSINGQDLFTDRSIQIDLSSSQKALVVFFLSSRCPCAESHLSYMGDLASQYKEFSFVAIHSDNKVTKSEAKAHYLSRVPQKETKPSYVLLQDKKSFWANRFGAVRTPQVFVVNHRNQILYEGGITSTSQFDSLNEKKYSMEDKNTPFYLERALDQVRKGQKPKPSMTRTLGCEIARAK